MKKTVVHSVFEKIAEQFPENIAIKEGDRYITYDTLNRKANRLAGAIHNKGVGRDTVVGLFLPAGIEYVISMLGVAKAGGIFMPLDIDSPGNLVKRLLMKVTPALIICNEARIEELYKEIAEYGLADKIKCFSLFEAEDSNLSDTNPELKSKSDDGNYIIFTSGSTGEPKAILGCHKGLGHFINWEIKEFSLDDSIRVSQLAPTTFDVSLRDILVPLLTGGLLCIPSRDDMNNPRRLLFWMKDMGLTLVHCVPSIFRLLIKEIEGFKMPGDALPELKYILLAGEPLYVGDVLKWRSVVGGRIELVNIYGPSETTLAKAFNRIREVPYEPGRIIPIGKPIPNSALLIMKKNELCRIGEIGEIYIKTPFRSKGYYNDPELTAAYFVQNPLNLEEKDVIYKTGDLGRYLPDRSIEFLGRMDNQVKVNGIRIELAEIEKNVLRNKAIAQSVLVAHKTSRRENYLACYYVENQKIEGEELRKYLRDWLPGYMIPSFFVRLEKFPLSLHGKIDRKALPKPEGLLYMNVKYEAPRNETEARIAAIIGEIFGIEKVGLNNSFIKLGGDSLKAMRIVSRIYQAFGLEIRFQDIFPDGTVRMLAEKINQFDVNQREKAGVEEVTAEELELLNK